MKVAMSYKGQLLLHLERYLELGWVVLPRVGGGTPRGMHWTEYRDNPELKPDWEQWKKWLDKYGPNLDLGCVLRPSQVAVFDFDDSKTYRAMELHLRDFPVARTKDGFHLWVKYVPELGDRNLTLLSVKEGDKIKVKLELKINSFVPLPPSRHREDKSFHYMWLRPPWELPEIPPPPQFLVALVEERNEERKLKRFLKAGFPARRRFKSKSWRGPSEEEVLSFLNRLGVRAIPITIQGQPAYRLRPCPLCGQRSSNAWAWTDTWRLCCFGERRCPARLSEGGLPWHVWSKMAEEQR